VGLIEKFLFFIFVFLFACSNKYSRVASAGLYQRNFALRAQHKNSTRSRQIPLEIEHFYYIQMQTVFFLSQFKNSFKKLFKNFSFSSK
jgi:hypothetical protein